MAFICMRRVLALFFFLGIVFSLQNSQLSRGGGTQCCSEQRDPAKASENRGASDQAQIIHGWPPGVCNWQCQGNFEALHATSEVTGIAGSRALAWLPLAGFLHTVG